MASVPLPTNVPPEVLYNAIVSAIQHMQLLSYFDVISSVVLVYDAVLTFELEVKLIWQAPWSILKVVYLVQKYQPFFDTIALGLRHQFSNGLSAEACYLDYNIAGYMFIAGVTLSEVILTWRAWAVWRKNRKMAIFLVVFFIIIFVPVFVVAHLFLSSIRFSLAPFHQLGCFITAANPILYLLWILLMVYDVVVLVLMCVPGVAAYNVGGNSELFKTIYRDGVLYYLYQLGKSTSKTQFLIPNLTLAAGYTAISVLNVIFTLTLPADLSSILTSTGRAMQAILTSRVVLRILHQGHADILYADPALGLQPGLATDGAGSRHRSALEFASVRTLDTEN